MELEKAILISSKAYCQAFGSYGRYALCMIQ
jgi:hypothetical protein